MSFCALATYLAIVKRPLIHDSSTSVLNNPKYLDLKRLYQLLLARGNSKCCFHICKLCVIAISFNCNVYYFDFKCYLLFVFHFVVYIKYLSFVVSCVFFT